MKMISLTREWTIESTRLTSFYNQMQPQSAQDINVWIRAITNQEAVTTQQTAVSARATGVLNKDVFVEFVSVPQRTDWLYRSQTNHPKVVDGIATLEDIGNCLNRYALSLEHLVGWQPTKRLALGFSLVLEVESMKAAQTIWRDVLSKSIAGGLDATDLFYRINRPTTYRGGPLVNRLITCQTVQISVIKMPQNPAEAAYNIAPESSGIVCRIDFEVNTDANTVLNLDTQSQVKMLGKLTSMALSAVKIK
jgi:hypothetical protein